MSKFPPKFTNGQIKDVIEIQADVFEENRGCLYTIHQDPDYSDSLNGVTFCEQRISVTEGGYGRGLHADASTYKIITCVAESFELILLDGRINSPTYGKNSFYRLKYNSGLQILVPPGVYNGHLAWKRATLHYAWSKSYTGPESQKTVSFYDPALGWPEDQLKTIKYFFKLSHRDMNETIPFSKAGFT